jgi:hypothetical protein
MRKGSILSITLALVTAQLLTVNLVQPALAAEPKSSVILTLLHNNDGESSLGADAIYKSASGDIKAGSAAAFAAVFEREIQDARSIGNAVLSVYAGDSFLPSKTSSVVSQARQLQLNQFWMQLLRQRCHMTFIF